MYNKKDCEEKVRQVMRKLSLLVWITQLGLSVAVPLGGFVLLGVWLHNRFGWGGWVIVAGTIIGGICALDGLRISLQTMERLSKDKESEDKPPVSFNEHQ